jgi:hypothetical protein
MEPRAFLNFHPPPSAHAHSIYRSRALEERIDEDADSEEALIAEMAAAVHPSELMQDIGYACCQSAGNVKEFFKKFPDVNEADVAAILSMMLRTRADSEESSSESSGWNLTAFVDTIKELVIPPPKAVPLLCSVSDTRCFFSLTCRTPS